MININKEQLKRDYVTFEGRLSRDGFRKHFLILFLISLAIQIVGYIIGWPGIYSLITFPISIALAVAMFSISIRRFHDIGQTGWLSLLLIIPLVNLAVIIYLLIANSSITPNKYGI